MRARRALVIGLVGVIAIVGALGLGQVFARGGKLAAMLPDPCPIQLFKDMLTPGVHAISMASPTSGWVVGEEGIIFHYTNGAWRHECSPSKRDLNAIVAISPNEAWTVGDWGTILHYRDGAWTQVASPTDFPLAGLAMVSRDEGWATAGGDSGLLLHYHNGVWTRVQTHLYASFSDITMRSPTDGWAIGQEVSPLPKSGQPPKSVVLHYTNGIWTRVPSAPNLDMEGISFVSSTEAWVAEGNGLSAMHYTDGQWAPLSPSRDYTGTALRPGSLSCVRMLSANEGWASGRFGELLHYTGGQWNVIPAPVQSDIDKLAPLSAHEVWAVAQFSVLHYDGAHWTSTPLNLPRSSP
ncbi:MAG TPA: hypothetical protein VF792_11925 [Ktedonobacterales bacterium]